MDPEYSIQAASSYAERKLSYAFLKDVYNSAWLCKYSEILEKYMKQLKNINASYQYYSRYILKKDKESSDDSGEYKIYLSEEIDFGIGYRDYNLRKLKAIDKQLGYKSAQLYLPPHGFNSKEFGTLCYEKPCYEVCDAINEELTSICRFGKDKHVQESDAFGDEHCQKLQNAFIRAIKNADIAQFRKYLKSIEEIYHILRKARKDSFVRKHLSLDYNKVRYLLIYSKSVKWLLDRTEIEDDIQELFLYELVKSIDQQVEDEIRSGDAYTLDVFKWLIPKTYQEFLKIDKDNKPRLWELRARLGSFYDFAGSWLSENGSDIGADNKQQIQLVLHSGIIKLLLVAIEQEDNELINSLCEAAKKLVFADDKLKFQPQQLVSQHFILCGKMLEFLMDTTPKISPSAFKLLCFDKYDHTGGRDIDYDELVEFFLNSRKGHGLREYLREFETTDWERNPLSGGGFGTPMWTFSGNIEFDYMFIYLALLKMPLAEVEPISFEFSGYSLKEKIDKFKDIATKIEIYDFNNSKEKFIKWLDECDNLYKREEEKRIAESPLDPEPILQFKDAFWESYRETKTFLGFCVSRGYYSINKDISVKHRYTRRKNIFIDGHTSARAIAKGDGADISSYLDKEILQKILIHDAKNKVEAVDDVGSMLNRVCEWLTKEKTNRENGIIVFCGDVYVEGELYKSDYYVPSWKEDDDLVFSGYYKNYPIIKIHDPDKELICVAMNLKGWKGLVIRPEVVEKDIYGEINIREWTEKEIEEAIRKKKIEREDINRVKGGCPVEYELFWRLDEKVLPMKMVISLTTAKSAK